MSATAKILSSNSLCSTQGYSRVEHIARSILLGRFDWSNLMAMYSAYFDESGAPDDGSYLVVSGAVSSTDQWLRFENEWTELLAPFGTKVFHIVDFDKRNKPFQNLTDTEANELFDNLVNVILFWFSVKRSRVLAE